MKIEKKKKLVKKWFQELQNIICNNVEQLEKKIILNLSSKNINGNKVNLEL